MAYSGTTEALLHAIKSDLRSRVDHIVEYAEFAAGTLGDPDEIETVLQFALSRVEEALSEAAQAMAREIHLERLR
ncbi:MAG: hypothetical protein ACE5HF_03820 [Gemmatimonadota bacterium]